MKATAAILLGLTALTAAQPFHDEHPVAGSPIRFAHGTDLPTIEGVAHPTGEPLKGHPIFPTGAHHHEARDAAKATVHSPLSQSIHSSSTTTAVVHSPLSQSTSESSSTSSAHPTMMKGPPYPFPEGHEDGHAHPTGAAPLKGHPVAAADAHEKRALQGTAVTTELKPYATVVIGITRKCDNDGELLCNGDSMAGVCTMGQVIFEDLRQGARCINGKIQSAMDDDSLAAAAANAAAGY